ncbi:MAG: ATP-binding protein [Sumerlaeia bacterium]
MDAAKHTGEQERDVVDLELSCKPHSRMLGSLRCIVTNLAKEHGFQEEQIGQIEMAVDEACANVIRHAYDETQRCNEEIFRISIRLTMCQQAMTIHVIDYGVGLRNKPKGASNVAEYVERGANGGLGLHIIDSFMDEVRYEYPNNSGTHVIMKKYLPTMVKNS